MRKRLYLGIITLFGAVGLQTMQAATPLKYDEKMVTGKLENGLIYYIYPNDNPKGEAVYRLFIKAGSVYETERQKGLAHFLEHMAFNGSENFPADGMVRFLESKGAKFGADLNAHTSFNETVYKLQLPSSDPAMVDSTMMILADWAAGLSISPEEVEKERGVIMSEWLSKQDVKREGSNIFLMALLNDSRYSERITIGDTAVIKNCDRNDIADYYKKWYHPSLMAVAVAGDVDAKAVERMIHDRFGKISGKNAPEWKQYLIEPYRTDSATIFADDRLNKIEMDIIRLIPLPVAVTNEEDYESYLLRSVINRLVKQRFSDYSFNNPAYKKGSLSQSSFLNASGVYLESVEMVPGKMKKGINDFIAHRNQIMTHGFTTDEIERAKKVILSNMQRKVDVGQSSQSAKIMDEIYSDFYVGNRLISQKDELELVKKTLPAIDSVAIVNALHALVGGKSGMRVLLRGTNKVYDEIGDENALLNLITNAYATPTLPYGKKVTITENLCQLGAPGRIVSMKAIPDIDAVDMMLDNGARVIFRRSDLDKNKISVTALRKGGMYSLDSLQYYSGMFAKSVVGLSGAGNMSRDELNYYKAGNSASMVFLPDNTRTGLIGSAYLKDAPMMFDLMYAKWVYPRLDIEAFNQTVEKTKESYRTKQKTPGEIFGDEVSHLLNGKNYSNAELTDSIIDNCVRAEDMIPLHNRFFGPATGYTFVILADAPLDSVKGYITDYIGALPKGEVNTEWITGREPISYRNKVFHRHTGDTPKASVMLIYQQDVLPESQNIMSIKSKILQNVLRTKLLGRLREEMGMIYSVGVSSSSTLHPAPLSRTTISFVCKPEDVDTLLVATRKELNNFYEHPEQFEDMVRDVKMNLIKEHKLNLQKNSFWSSWMRNSVFNGEEDWNYLNNYESIVEGMTAAEISRFAKELLDTASYTEAILYPKDETTD